MRPLELKSETLELNSVDQETPKRHSQINRLALAFQTQTLERKTQTYISKATR